MKLLALDTAASRSSVAIYIDGDVLEDVIQAERMQSETLIPMLERILERTGLRLTGLDALAFGRGPGPFTGLRVAAAVIQGLAYGAHLPVVPVSNLAALAAAAHTRHAAGRILACLDARMQEVYWAAYEFKADSLEPVCPESLSPPAGLTLPPGAWFGAGSGWAAYPEALKARVPGLAGVDATVMASAADIAKLAYKSFLQGAAVPPERALPIYLRDKVATPKI